jgi:hypothetical protein
MSAARSSMRGPSSMALRTVASCGFDIGCD